MYTTKTLHHYLKKHYTRASAKTYEREILIFLQAVPNAKTANCQDIIEYLTIKRQTQKPSSIHRILQSIKKYYNYLLDQELRQDHPAQFINLKDYKNKQPISGKRLLNEEEIQQLWDYFLTKKYRYQMVKNRNICIAGLLLHQALQSGEIRRLNLEDLDLQKGEIFIHQTTKSRARTLPLDRTQLLAFFEYVHQDRPKLLAQNITENALFISQRQSRDKGETLHGLIRPTRHLIPGRKINPNLIRMSVISNKFKQGLSLQEVQYFAGHRYPSSTERYKSNHLQALQQGILKHHPLK